MLRAVANSSSIRAALALGLGGVAFTAGNLILARALPSAEYGLVTLFIGILSVASLTAPLGLDLLVARRGLPLGPPLRRAVLVASGSVAAVTAAIAAVAYDLAFDLTLALFFAIAAAGMVQGVTAHFQGQRQFGIAAWILQTSNFVLIPVGLVALAGGLTTATAPAVLIAALMVVAAAWAALAQSALAQSGPTAAQASATPPVPCPPAIRTLWGEALALVTITAAAAVFMQLERLVLVPTIGIQGLALFGVVAALVGSPYRMLQAAVQFTLIPELRATPGFGERRRLLSRELLIVGAVAGLGSIVLWVLAPRLANLFLAGRYELTDVLMLAAIVSGLLKVASGFTTSIAVALGDERELRWISVTAWLSIAIATAGAFVAAPWGLPGVLYGIAVGWLTRVVAAGWIAFPHLFDSTWRTPLIRSTLGSKPSD